MSQLGNNFLKDINQVIQESKDVIFEQAALHLLNKNGSVTIEEANYVTKIGGILLQEGAEDLIPQNIEIEQEVPVEQDYSDEQMVPEGQEVPNDLSVEDVEGMVLTTATGETFTITDGILMPYDEETDSIIEPNVDEAGADLPVDEAGADLPVDEAGADLPVDNSVSPDIVGEASEEDMPTDAVDLPEEDASAIDAGADATTIVEGDDEVKPVEESTVPSQAAAAGTILEESGHSSIVADLIHNLGDA